MEKQKSSVKLKEIIGSITVQNKEHEKCDDELEIANKKLVREQIANEKCSEELMIANNELSLQSRESENGAEELIIANNELVSQIEDKEKQEQGAEDRIKMIATKEKEQSLRIIELSEMIKKDIFSVEEIEVKVGYIKHYALDLENSIKDLYELIKSYLSPDDDSLEIK